MKAQRPVYDPKVVAEYQLRLKEYYGDRSDLRCPAYIGFALIPLGFLLFGLPFFPVAFLLFAGSAYCYEASTNKPDPTDAVPCPHCGEAPFGGRHNNRNPTHDICHQCGYWLVWMRPGDEEYEARKEYPPKEQE